MAERTRLIRIEFCVTEQERKLIQNKMAQLGTKTWAHTSARWRLTATSSRWTTPSRKNLAAAVSRVASNINQICRRINSTGHLYAEDIAELKERQTEIWSLLKEIQRKEL